MRHLEDAMRLSPEQFNAVVTEEKKDPDYQKKLAADQCDPSDLTDPRHPDYDDYFDKLGEEIDAHPLGGHARPVRGG